MGIDEYSTMRQEALRPSDPQLTYAAVLSILGRVSLVLMVATYSVYVLRLIPGGSSPDQVALHWNLSTVEYAKAMGKPMGWARLTPLMNGESLSLIALLFLGLATIVALIRVTPIFARQRDWAYTAFALVEMAVLVIAASGIATLWGH